MDWLVWLVVIAVFVVRGLLKAANGGTGADQARQTARQAARQTRQELRRQARQPSPRWQPPQQAPIPPPPNWPSPQPARPTWPPASPVADWFPTPLPQPAPAAEMSVQSLNAEERLKDLREAARVAAAPMPSPLDAPAPAERYIGSAALESTLDSTIESSLFGVAGDSLTSSVLPGGAAAPTLPAELEAQVRGYLESRHEVAAVRLVCDELDVGILEALRAVRSVSGLPSP